MKTPASQRAVRRLLVAAAATFLFVTTTVLAQPKIGQAVGFAESLPVREMPPLEVTAKSMPRVTEEKNKQNRHLPQK
jgi:hypothetical protein